MRKESKEWEATIRSFKDKDNKQREPSIPKSDLEELYIRRHLTLEEIGKIYSKTRQRVWQLVKKTGINTVHAERFMVVCDRCGKEYMIHRKRYRVSSTHYCSTACYLSDRKNEHYRPHRNGQREARRIMAKHIGRPLTTGEIVHHIDSNCNNNTLDNLILFPTNAAHIKFHHSLRINSKP